MLIARLFKTLDDWLFATGDEEERRGGALIFSGFIALSQEKNAGWNRLGMARNSPTLYCTVQYNRKMQLFFVMLFWIEVYMVVNLQR